MDQLDVYFGQRTVGHMNVDDLGRFTFEYARSWVEEPGGFAISLSLPLAAGKQDERASHAFFANLLPEGRVRQLVARRLGLSETNDFALLDAPFYDLLSTGIYPRLSRRLAMKLAETPDGIPTRRRDWQLFAENIGVGSAFVFETVRRFAEEMPQGSRALEKELKDRYPRFTVARAIMTLLRKRSRWILQGLDR